jgi:hypothetical protein
MEYQIGNENLIMRVQEDGHADLMRGDTVFLCMSQSETLHFRRWIMDDQGTTKVLFKDIMEYVDEEWIDSNGGNNRFEQFLRERLGITLSGGNRRG